MAIVIEEVNVNPPSAAVNTLSAVFTVDAQPDAGHQWMVAAGMWFNEGGAPQLALTAPVSLGALEAGVATAALECILKSKESSGSDGSTSTVTKAGTARSMAIAAINLSGAEPAQTSGILMPATQVTTITVASDVNVSTDGSLAIMTVFKRGGAAYTYGYGSGWAEIGKGQSSSTSRVEIFVASKLVNSGALASGQFDLLTGAANRLAAVIVVYPPSVLVAPSVDMESPPGNMGDLVEGDVVVLTGEATGGNTPYKNWLWQVLEGGSGTTPVATQNGTMAFPNEGTWTLQLTVDGDDDQGSLPVTQTITVVPLIIPNTPPVITGGATAAYSINEGTTAVATIVATDADGDQLVFNIGGGADGSFFTIGGASGVLAFINPPAFLAPLDANANNVYEVIVQVSDGVDVDTQAISVTILEVNLPPVANAGPDQEVDWNAVVQLDGSGSSDPEGQPLTYIWQMLSRPTGSLAALSNPALVNPTFTADVEAGGAYILGLVVNDGSLSSLLDDRVLITARPRTLISYEYSDTIPAGHVISSTPIPGTWVPGGEAVELVISLGPLKHPVPNLTGLTQVEAQGAIVLAGMTVGVVSTSTHATIAAGYVISQNPQPGAKVDAGDPVDFVLSLGPGQKKVPHTTGQAEADAEDTIDDEGLETEV